MAEVELSTTWPETGPPRIWQRPLGAGYSSIVTHSGSLFTMYRVDDDEIVVALSADTSQTLWEHRYQAPVDTADPTLDTRYGKGPNATPLVFKDRIVTLGFNGDVRCLHRTSGALLWSRELRAEMGIPVPSFGHSASPIRYGHTVILVAGGALALDLEDGSLVWRNRGFDGSYASPVLADAEGGPLLVAAVRGEIVALDPDDGTLRWRREHANQFKSILSSPLVIEGDRVWVSAKWVGTRMLQLSGVGEGSDYQEAWHSTTTQIGLSNAVRKGSYVYATHGATSHFLSATDIHTGRVAWRDRAFAQANLIRAGNAFVILDFDGELGIVDLTPMGPVVLTRARVFDSPTWTPPTLASGWLFVRNQEIVIALEVGR